MASGAGALHPRAHLPANASRGSTIAPPRTRDGAGWSRYLLRSRRTTRLRCRRLLVVQQTDASSDLPRQHLCPYLVWGLGNARPGSESCLEDRSRVTAPGLTVSPKLICRMRTRCLIVAEDDAVAPTLAQSSDPSDEAVDRMRADDSLIACRDVSKSTQARDFGRTRDRVQGIAIIRSMLPLGIESDHRRS